MNACYDGCSVTWTDYERSSGIYDIRELVCAGVLAHPHLSSVRVGNESSNYCQDEPIYWIVTCDDHHLPVDRIELVRLVIAHGGDVNYQEKCYHSTPLMNTKDAGVFSELLLLGADVGMLSLGKRNLLHHLIISDNARDVKFIREIWYMDGVSELTFQPESDGLTPYDLYVQRLAHYRTVARHDDILEFLRTGNPPGSMTKRARK